MLNTFDNDDRVRERSAARLKNTGLAEHFLIAGSLDELPAVHRWAETLLVRADTPQSVSHNVLLALSECVTNAIRHGCCSDPTQKVKLECRAELGKQTSVVVFNIRDHGKGFRLDQLPDPTVGHHLLNTGGRGVFIVRALATDATFESSPNGTSVSIEFKWPSGVLEHC